MNLIGAVDRNWAIGKDNKLLVSIPNDMKLFRELTLNKIIVTGRKTMDTFQNGKPLMNRINIVLSENKQLDIKDAKVVNSIEQLFEVLEELYKEGYTSEDVFVIGGESVYRQLEKYCDQAYVTKIDFEYDSDSYFPNLDEKKDWNLIEHSDEQTYFDLDYSFLKYKRV